MVKLLIRVCDNFTSAFAEAGEILIAEASRANEPVMTGQCVQLAKWLYIICSLPLYALLFTMGGPFISLLGFENETSNLATDYIPFALTGHFLRKIFGYGISQLMWNEGIGGTVVLLEIASNLVYFTGTILQIYAFGSLSMSTLGLIEFGIAVIFCIALAHHSVPWIQKYDVGIFENWAFQEKHLTQSSWFGVVCVSLCGATALFIFQSYIIWSFATNMTFFMMMGNLVGLACLASFAKAIACHANGILVALGCSRFASVFVFSAFIGVTLPMFTSLVFKGNYGLTSMMMACAFGSSIEAFAGHVLAFSTNWQSAVKTEQQNDRWPAPSLNVYSLSILV